MRIVMKKIKLLVNKKIVGGVVTQGVDYMTIGLTFFSCFLTFIFVTIAVVTLQAFYLGKDNLLTVYLGKLDFLSVTNFSPGNLPRENFIVWVLDMSRKQ